MDCYNKIIPYPKFILEDQRIFSYPATISGDFSDAAKAFKKYAKKALGLEFSDGNAISLCLDDKLLHGEYTIKATEASVVICAADSEGANYALATLLQVMENTDGQARVPSLEIHDKSDNDYRGLMLDCARNPHPLPLLKEYIDVCWFYKIKYLHLHLTDDQAYTLPSVVMPDLTSKHNYYTKEEISRLVEYARERDIQLVPEIDLPGHSKAIIKAYPQLCSTEDGSILCFHSQVIEKMQELYRELCNMFPYSQYIHIGADESDIMAWNNCEECIEYGRSLGIKKEEILPYFWPDWHLVERFLCHFINKMAEAIVEMGRKPLVWEGFSREVNEYMTRDVAVMVFENFYQTPTSLMKNGFDIINCSWRPTYVVVPEYKWDKKECWDWDVGTFSAVHPDSPYFGGKLRLESHKNILGGQLNAWGDFLGKYEKGLEWEKEAILDRIPAIAESTWNDSKKDDYAHFLLRHKHSSELLYKMINDDAQ